MSILSHTYHQVKNRYVLSIENKEFLYNKLSKNDLFLRLVNEKLVLKIHIKRKYPFQRILFKYIKSLDIWVSKFPNSDDLLILKKDSLNNSFTIKIYIDQWNYRTLIISDLLSYNKLI